MASNEAYIMMALCTTMDGQECCLQGIAGHYLRAIWFTTRATFAVRIAAEAGIAQRTRVTIARGNTRLALGLGAI